MAKNAQMALLAIAALQGRNEPAKEAATETLSQMAFKLDALEAKEETGK